MSGALYAGFFESALAHPRLPALAFGARTVSYEEVEEAVRRWAAALLDVVEGRPRRVGILANRTLPAYAGPVAALLAGAAFVPLSPTFPASRTAAIADRADLDAVLVDAPSVPYAHGLRELMITAPAFLLPESDARALGPVDVAVVDRSALLRSPPLANAPSALADAVAYLLFTSGTTGEPKGVPITYANVVHFLRFNQRRYEIGPDDRLTQTFPHSFDLSIFDLFMSWSTGACLCVPEPLQLLAPARYVRDAGITVWFSVPSLAALALKKGRLQPDSLSSLRLSLFCGEPLPRVAAEAWQAAAPRAALENLYGPTELTIACAVYRWDGETSPAECVGDVVPIGRLYDGLDGLVVDDELSVVPAGVPGELCVSGPQTFAGYWNAPAETAVRIFERENDRGELARWYRTGDRVVLQAGGSYAYLGRADSQVKVLGHRVELGEVEAALRGAPGVIEAAAIPWPVSDGLAAGIVGFVTGRGISADTVREAAARRLPSYMRPSKVLHLDAMPLTSNGKIDRSKLRELA